MINELREFEYDIIESMGYVIYDEIGRKQNGDTTWSKVIKEDQMFIVTGTRYSQGGEKKEYRELYDSAEDFKLGKLSNGEKQNENEKENENE
jgi:hypothetical protein